MASTGISRSMYTSEFF